MDQRWIKHKTTMYPLWINGDDRTMVDQRWVIDASTIHQQWVNKRIHLHQGCIQHQTMILLDSTCINRKNMNLPDITT